MTQNKKLYNIALDLYMIHNCHRLAKILGNKFKPELYYDSRDREFILFELDPDQAYEIWKQIKCQVKEIKNTIDFNNDVYYMRKFDLHGNLIKKYTFPKINLNPICLAISDCNNCFRHDYCSNNTKKIAEIADEEYLEIETILSKKWYQKCIQTVTELLGLED